MNWKHNVPPSRQRPVSRGNALSATESTISGFLSTTGRVSWHCIITYICPRAFKGSHHSLLDQLGRLLVHLSRTSHVLFTTFYSSPGSECAEQKHSKASLMNLWRVGSNKTHCVTPAVWENTHRSWEYIQQNRLHLKMLVSARNLE